MTQRPLRLLMAGIAMLGQLAWLFVLRGRHLLNADGKLVIGGVIVGMALVAIVPLVPRIRRSPGRGLDLAIIGGCALLQLVGLMWLWPVLSTDVGRHRLDGLLWLSGQSPYQWITSSSPSAATAQRPTRIAAMPSEDQFALPDDVTSEGAAEAEPETATGGRIRSIFAPPKSASTMPAIPAESPGGTGAEQTSVPPRMPHATALLTGADALDAVFLPAAPSAEPPVAESIFVAGRALEMVTVGPAKLTATSLPASAGWRETIPAVYASHRAVPLRTMAAIAAIGATALLVRILRASGHNPWLAVLFAWNPLLTLEAAGNGRVDVIGILLLLTMVRLLQKRNVLFATIALVLACGVEPTAVLIAPLLVREIASIHRWKIAVRCVLVALGTAALTYLPILITRHGFSGWMTAVALSAQLREGNSLPFALARSFANRTGWSFDHSFIRSLMLLGPAVVAILVLLKMLRERRTMSEAGYWLLLLPLLFKPAIDPSAALWPLALAPLMRRTPGWAALTWAATITIAYAAWHLPGDVLPTRVVLAEYVPVAVALFVGWSDERRIAELERRPVAVAA